MATFTWIDANVPTNMKVTQVSCLLFDSSGRILLCVDSKDHYVHYFLPGGHPEENDISFEDTCKREVLEEVNMTIKEPIYVGYQQVIESEDSEPYAQVRMTGFIEKIGEKRPDTDNGKIYDRLLVAPDKAIQLLNWGDVGKEQIYKAVKIMNDKYGLTLTNRMEQYV